MSVTNKKFSINQLDIFNTEYPFTINGKDYLSVLQYYYSTLYDLDKQRYEGEQSCCEYDSKEYNIEDNYSEIIRKTKDQNIVYLLGVNKEYYIDLDNQVEKDDIMYTGMKARIVSYPELKRMLLETNIELIDYSPFIYYSILDDIQDELINGDNNVNIIEVNYECGMCNNK